MARRYSASAALLVAAVSLGSVAEAFASETDSPGGSGTGAPSTASRQTAESRYREGAAAYTEARYADAIELFRQADRLWPSAALSFNVARAYEKIGDVPATLAWYRDYLRRAPGSGDEREVKEKVDRLEAELARRGVQQVTVRSEPSGATIVLDGNPVGVTPWTGELSPGAHTVSLRLRGYEDTDRTVQLTAEDAADVSAILSQEPTAVVREAPRTSLRPATAVVPPGHAARTWGIVAAGAGVAALGGALTLELLRRDSLDDARKEDEQLKAARHVEVSHDRQIAARVLAFAGLGLAAGGGVLLLLDAGRDARPRGPVVAVTCGGAVCGAVASGAFE